MQKSANCEKVRNIVQIVIIALLCVFLLLADFIKITYLQDPLQNAMLSKIIQQGCGIAAIVMIMLRLNIRLFSKPQGWLYLIPCIIIAVDNFQFCSYFNENMHLATQQPINFLLFAVYCLCVGVFEECVFRGVIFGILASYLPNNKKGFLLTYLFSSLVFGAAHLFNGFSLSVLWQVGYTVLTGGLFAFCLIKTKNILCCGFVHGLYNFCGLLFEKFDLATGVIGLGNGVIWDTGTVVTMLIVSIVIGVFIVYKTLTYPETERVVLYDKLGVKPEKRAEEQANKQ